MAQIMVKHPSVKGNIRISFRFGSSRALISRGSGMLMIMISEDRLKTMFRMR